MIYIWAFIALIVTVELALIWHKLASIEKKIDTVIGGEVNILADLNRLIAAVQAEKTVEASLLALLNNVVAEIRSARGDQAALDVLADTIEGNTQAMTAAVVAGTDVVNPPAANTAPAPPAQPPAAEPTPAAEVPATESGAASSGASAGPTPDPAPGQ